MTAPLAVTTISMQNGDGFGFGLFVAVAFIIAFVALAGMWLVYMKAGQPGWGVLVPFYNLYLMVVIAERPGWWFWLLLIPGVNAVIGLILSIDLAERFGKGPGFGIGLFFLGLVFYPILGFGEARYESRGNRG